MPTPISIGRKTGVSALVKAMERICIVIKKFSPALVNLISAAVTAGTITADQGTILTTFLGTAQEICTLWKLISGY